MTMAKSETILVQDGDTVIELTGADKEAFIADRLQMQEAQAILEAEQTAKQEARTSALTKLATIAGLNEEEMTALGL
jgi:hypothetical protein